ncbi:MAG: hypothetical protein M3011_07090 [Actinomycetota bacterium]|nr:hypothetical protein [Actinomycetota bacterium]
MNHLAVSRRHDLEDPGYTTLKDLRSHITSEAPQRLPSQLSVPPDVDNDPTVMARGVTLHDRAGKFLHGRQGLATRADEQTEAFALHGDLLGVLGELVTINRVRGPEGIEEAPNERLRNLPAIDGGRVA